MSDEDYGDAWVCQDCYFAHHFGAHQHDEIVELYDEESEEDRVPLVEVTVPLWYAGEDDEPVGGWYEIRHNHTLDHNREPLGLIEDSVDVTDNTCSNHYYGQDPEENDDGEISEECAQCGQRSWENGIHEFSHSPCHGCGSPLGGSRHRLHLWMREEVTT